MLQFTVEIYGDDEKASEIYEVVRTLLVKHRADFAIVHDWKLRPDPRKQKRQAAKNFLEEAFEGYARNEGQAAHRLIALAAERGITESTLRAAKAELRMKSQPQGPGKPTLWMPPGTMDPEPVEVDAHGVPVL